MYKPVFWLSLLVIFVLSLLPGEQLPPQVGQIWDKAQHALGFLWLGLSGHLAYRRRPLRVLAGVLLAGVAIELAQAITPWRHGDWQDWVADAVGAVTASVLWWSMRQLPAAHKR
jgi:VanZ family protein